jgi:hypothetical protein
MPKKSRRAKAKRRAAVARVVQERQLEQSRPASAEAPAAPAVRAVPAGPRMSPKAQDLGSRYSYVMPEMKRIGIIAGSIIVILIVLSFVLG